MDGADEMVMTNRYRDDAAIDAPPLVGVDERRMQVRAYNIWSALLGGYQWPSIGQLDIGSLDFADHAVLLDFSDGVESPMLTYVGELLRHESGLGDQRHRLNDVPRGSLLSRLTDHYLQIFANHAPIGFEAEFVNAQQRAIAYRGILLPFSSDGQQIDHILGVINWKEAATPQQETGLISSFEGALESLTPTVPPHLQAVPTLQSVATWADGPSLFDHNAMVSGDDDDEGDTSIYDRLADARNFADQAHEADGRRHAALYRAMGKAWDFALAAQDNPESLAELIEDAGLKPQSRSPMTPIVKLVFGAGCDRSRIAEYAAVLSYAQEQGFAVGALEPYLAAYDGGLKNLLRDIRDRRRGTAPHAAPTDAAAERLRVAAPAATIAAASIAHDISALGDQEFILLIGRVTADGQIAVVGHSEADANLVDKAMRKASPFSPRA
jgi:hypothetical protein